MLDIWRSLEEKGETGTRKPWISQETFIKMDEQRKRKNVSNEEGRNN
jgi:hypothetical protein